MSNANEEPTTFPIVKGTDQIKDNWFHEFHKELWPGQCFSLELPPPPSTSILHTSRSLYQDILILQTVKYGKCLVLDGVIQVCEFDEFAYQEMITHLPLFSHPNPKSVLVIGGGDGGVLREILKHPEVVDVTIVEIDADVIKYSQQYIPSVSNGAFVDPRVTIKIQDGFQYLKDHINTYDVIITDSSDPVGPASSLFEASFFKLLYASLRSGGIICTQAETPWLHERIIRPLIRGVRGVCDGVEYAVGSVPSYPCGCIGFILATKKDEANVDHDGEVKVVSCKNPVRMITKSQQKGMQYYNEEAHRGSFMLPEFVKRIVNDVDEDYGDGNDDQGAKD